MWMHTLLGMVLCVGFPASIVVPFIPYGMRCAREQRAHESYDQL